MHVNFGDISKMLLILFVVNSFKLELLTELSSNCQFCLFYGALKHFSVLHVSLHFLKDQDFCLL